MLYCPAVQACKSHTWQISTVLQISMNNYAKIVSRKICMYKIVQAQRWLLKWFEFAVVGKHVACDFRILCRARPWLEECTVAEPAIYNICVRAIYMQALFQEY